MRIWLVTLVLVSVFAILLSDSNRLSYAADGRPVMIIDLDGPITPASDDFLATALTQAKERNAKLLVIRLNTPGGLLTSMQSMVENLLTATVPTVIYVAPSGAGAVSAGVFITLASNFAVMAPGTTIGAAHPVTGGGGDIGGDMRAKVENFSVSLIKAIAEQRKRNVKWAELAVRESVSITDSEALSEKVIDFVASDLGKVFETLEGKTVTIAGQPVTLSGLRDAPQVTLEMSLKQKVVRVLSDPNIAILLGLGAMLGLGLELYHPGAIFPGVVGVICLVLSLTAAQVLPINYGGLALLLLAVLFFVAEAFLPGAGIWGAAGIICLVLGSIYFVDSDAVWGVSGYSVNNWLIGTIAGSVGLIMLMVGILVLRSSGRKVETGKEGLVDQSATVLAVTEAPQKGRAELKVQAQGAVWDARFKGERPVDIARGELVKIVGIENGMMLLVERL